MTILLFELKSMWKTALGWGLSLCAVTAAMSAIYPTYRDGAAEVTKLLESYPPEFIKAFGLDVATLFSLNGFFAFVSLYIVLTGSIMALHFGLSIFGREKRTKTSDFLLTKPISRTQVFAQKLLASLLLLVLTNIAFFITMWAMYGSLATPETSQTIYYLLGGSITLVEFIMLGIGVFIATMLPKIKVPGSIATGTAFMLFIISMLYGIFGDEWLRYVSPFKYFDAAYIMEHGAYDTPWLLLGAAIFVASIAASCVYFSKKDLASV